MIMNGPDSESQECFLQGDVVAAPRSGGLANRDYERARFRESRNVSNEGGDPVRKIRADSLVGRSSGQRD
jgi:hypothetical protein